MKQKKKEKSPPQPKLQPAIEPNEKWIIIGSVGLYILTVVWGLLSDGTWDNDCVGRYYNVRHALEDPYQLIRLWNRPLFSLLFFLTLQLGKQVIVFQMGLLSVLGCYALYKAVKAMNLPNAYLVIPFVAFQTFYFPISYHALAEPLAAVVISISILLYVRQKYLAFALVTSLLPLARLELSPLLLFSAILLIQQRQWKYIPLLGMGVILLNFAGTLHDGDPIWLYTKTIGSTPAENKYGQTGFGHYFHRYIFVIGPVIFYFFIIGLLERIYHRKFDFLILIPFLTGFMIYVIFSWLLTLGQAAGFLRHLVAISPLAAVLALEGYNHWIEAVINKQQRLRITIYSVIIIILTIVFFSKDIRLHHIITDNGEYYKLALILSLTTIFVITTYLLPEFFIEKSKRFVISILIVVFAAGYTLITEPPNKNMTPEREALEQISKWYVEHNLQDRPTYANNPWFFYSQNLNPHDENMNQLTMETINQAPPSSIIVWESYYSHSNIGDVPFLYLQNHSDYKELKRIITPEENFGTAIFEKIKQ